MVKLAARSSGCRLPPMMCSSASQVGGRIAGRPIDGSESEYDHADARFPRSLPVLRSTPVGRRDPRPLAAALGTDPGWPSTLRAGSWPLQPQRIPARRRKSRRSAELVQRTQDPYGHSLVAFDGESRSRLRGRRRSPRRHRQHETRSGFTERLGIRIRAIGKLELLPDAVQRMLHEAESATRHHDRLLLNIGVGYGGRQEIIDAVRSYLHDSFMRRDQPEDTLQGLTVDAVAKYLYAYDCPDPDLIIRTSGEVRLSGFMLWQSAYSEFYFCDAYWPAFRKLDFLRAIRSYQQRQRRFGK